MASANSLTISASSAGHSATSGFATNYDDVISKIASAAKDGMRYLVEQMPATAILKLKLSLVLTGLVDSFLIDNKRAMVRYFAEQSSSSDGATSRVKVLTKTDESFHFPWSTALSTIVPLLFEVVPHVFSTPERYPHGKSLCEGLAKVIEVFRVVQNYRFHDTAVQGLVTYLRALQREFEEKIDKSNESGEGDPPPTAAKPRVVMDLFD
jgi:hypothetical protein